MTTGILTIKLGCFTDNERSQTGIIRKQLKKNKLTWYIFWKSNSFFRSSSWSIRSWSRSQSSGSRSLRVKTLSGVTHPYSGAMNRLLPSGLFPRRGWRLIPRESYVGPLFNPYPNSVYRRVSVNVYCGFWSDYDG